MTFIPSRKRRVVVPLWRPIASTVRAGVLAMPVDSSRDIGRISRTLQKRLQAWRTEPSVIAAAELVETALVEAKDSEAIRAAQTLVSNVSPATELVKKQAVLLLSRESIQIEGLDSNPQAPFCIRAARERTRVFPYEAYAWVDLALAHTIAGSRGAADRAMRVALQLAPNDRHVLRSAARFYLHLGENDRAHDLLLRSEATPHDPWLMAAEIALSELVNCKPKMFKRGSALVEEGGIFPRHQSELSSAIATVHLSHGNRKARRFFDRSLVDPTGNSLAQAQWASPRFGGQLVNPHALDAAKDAVEAKAFQAHWAGNFLEVMRWSEVWAEEEPFSSRPLQFGSAAAIAIEDYEAALALADKGLKRQVGDDAILSNNKIYALVALERYEEALPILDRCLRNITGDSTGPLHATAGMFALRIGEWKEGIREYREAISIFKRTQNVAAEALALAYFAKEAARARLPKAQEIFREATEISKNLKFVPEAKVVLSQAEAWLGANALRDSTLTTAK